jgi:hypothetical protein
MERNKEKTAEIWRGNVPQYSVVDINDGNSVRVVRITFEFFRKV